MSNEKDSYSIKLKLTEFCENTTAHGPPRIVGSRDWPARTLWTLLFVISIAALSIQAYFLLEKFNRTDKLSSIEIIYDSLPFPAVTVCNLNPYKNSLARQHVEIQKLLQLFDEAMARVERLDKSKVRLKRQIDDDGLFRPTYKTCQCFNSICQPYDRELSIGLKPNETTCLCFYNNTNPQLDQLWPCYPVSKWRLRKCSHCLPSGVCSFVNSKQRTTGNISCYCADALEICMQMEFPKSQEISENVTTITTYPTQRPLWWNYSKLRDALGFEDLTDSMAIITKAKEDLLFAAGQLTDEEKLLASYGRDELIVKCVFQGRECEIENDFSIHMDPSYGACYTFNGSSVYENRTIDRAGSIFGLRLQLMVDVSDYLPFTESAGVRIAVNDPSEQPFPDTLGYSAPTGFLSSFGISLIRIERIRKPESSCVAPNIKSDSWIYGDKEYSKEACHRSCSQRLIISRCGCGDPRYPLPQQQQSCPLDDGKKRECLTEVLSEMIRNDRKKASDCQCAPSCMYENKSNLLFFKMACYVETLEWLSRNNGSERVQVIPRVIKGNGAIIEVYYEQLNYELYKEFIAYENTNLVSDFGGLLGLWMGISVVTCMEFMVFLWNIILPCFRKAKSATTTAKVKPIRPKTARERIEN